jgi:hypothetical protein
MIGLLDIEVVPGEAVKAVLTAGTDTICSNRQSGRLE